MTENRVDKINEALVVDEESMFDKNLEKMQKIAILNKGGEVLKRDELDYTGLDGSQEILLQLTGSWFADQGDLREGAEVDADYLVRTTSLKNKDVVSARISELKSEQRVESPKKGVYQIQSAHVGSILDELLDAVEG